MPAACAVVGKWYTMQDHASFMSDSTTKPKVRLESKRISPVFSSNTLLLVLQEGMAGAKFTSYARTAGNRTSCCLYFWKLVQRIVVNLFHPTITFKTAPFCESLYGAIFCTEMIMWLHGIILNGDDDEILKAGVDIKSCNCMVTYTTAERDLEGMKT